MLQPHSSSWLLWSGALLHTGDQSFKVTQEGHVERAREHGKTAAEGEGERMDELRGRGSSVTPSMVSWWTGAPPHLTLGIGTSTVYEGGCRCTAAWVKEEENTSDHRQRKREAKEANKAEVAPGVTVASLRRFRAALIGRTQGLPKRHWLCR